MRSFAFVVAAALVITLPAPVLAQAARATGTVRNIEGRPIKGATVRAMNPDAHPPEFTSVTDDKGRFAMIGLRSGTWTFRVDAEGFNPVEASAPMRVAGTPPMTFTLERALGPLPNALAADIEKQLAAAKQHRDAGRLDQAISAYQEIRTRNPKLTMVNLVLGDVYRRKAAQEGDPAARQALFDRALASYNALLDEDAERAKAAIESTRAEAAAASR